MKAKQINIDGIQFRSKLEGRWYLFMKRLGWHIEYEPDIEGLNGWIPDFLIIGKKHKILVDVKPIDRADEWNTHPDNNKILNSGVKKLHDYELLIVGTNLQLDKGDSMGIFYIRPDKFDTDMTKDDLYEDGNCIFSCVGDQIGFMTYMMGWCCRITGEGGKTYIFRGDSKDKFRKIDRYWNEAGTQLQWNAPTSEHYLEGKTHPNSNQHCLDCNTDSVNWWKRKNLFYCTKCEEVKILYKWEGEYYNSRKQYCVNSYYYKNFVDDERDTFFYATENSQAWEEGRLK